MIKKLIFVFFASLPICFGTYASTWNESTNKTVTAVQVLDHGGFVVWFDSEVASYCTPNGTNSVFFYEGQHNVTTGGIKALLSSALTALSTGMKVDIIHDNDPDGYCWGRYFKLKRN